MQKFEPAFAMGIEIANLSRGDELMQTEIALGLNEVRAMFDNEKQS